MFNLVSINKFQRSRLNFDLSAKVAHSTYLNIVFSETTKPIDLKKCIPKAHSMQVRNLYKDNFSSAERAVPWQYSIIRGER